MVAITERRLSTIERQKGFLSFSPLQCVAFASVLKTVYDIDEGRSLIDMGIPMSALRRREAEEVLTNYFPQIGLASRDLPRIFRTLIPRLSDGLTHRPSTFFKPKRAGKRTPRTF